MSVGSICTREVDLAEPDELVQVAAQRMNSRNVGSLLVLSQDSVPIGLLTDRDLAIRVVGRGLDPMTTTVSEVMTKAPEAIHVDTTIEMAITRMRSGPFRRLPVVDDGGKLIGLISLDNILELLVEEFNDIGKLLQKESPAGLVEFG
jgi:CBS domain-containing protein